MTTTGCNAKCPYCYERGVPVFSMSQDVANKVADFIVSRAKPGNRINIEWFGGEPLLNTRVIDIISNRITQELSDVPFSSSIITNASRINKDVIAKLSSTWHTKRLQITVDGIGQKYESVKGLGDNSFNYLISVLDDLASIDIEIDIRFNYNHENYMDIEDFGKFFSTYPYRDKLTFYSAKIFSESSKCGYFDLEKETHYVDTKMHQYGLVSGLQLLPRVFKTGCMAQYPEFFTIDPRGMLFKCDRRFLESNALSRVEDKTSDTFGANWNSQEYASKCHNCKLFPLCWGGCKYDRLTGIYPCYLTESIINKRLKLLLSDISDEMTSDIFVLTTGKRRIENRLPSLQYWN